MKLQAGPWAQIKYTEPQGVDLDFYGSAIAERLGPQIQRLSPDLLIPVPVHPSRRRARGFNQAEELARRLSERLGNSHVRGSPLPHPQNISPKITPLPQSAFKIWNMHFSSRPLPKEARAHSSGGRYLYHRCHHGSPAPAR